MGRLGGCGEDKFKISQSFIRKPDVGLSGPDSHCGVSLRLSPESAGKDRGEATEDKR